MDYDDHSRGLEGVYGDGGEFKEAFVFCPHCGKRWMNGW